jgi:hypothetical protein
VLTPLLRNRVKLADRRALATERRDLMHPGEPKGCFDIALPAPDRDRVWYLSADSAKTWFLERAHALGLK